MPLPRKLPLSRIRLSRAKSSSIFFSMAKVSFAYYTLRVLQLTGSWQIMLPALTSPLPLLDYGRLSVSFMHLRPKGLLAILLTAANHRFFIHFGEDHCRLSSDQSILEVRDNKRSLVLAFISNALLFGLPHEHQARFESLWVDQLAYTAPWRKHISGTVDDLNQMTSWVSSISTGSASSLTFCLKFLALIM